jgi:hypothetical protein
VTELQAFLNMLDRAGVGYGTRNDHNPAGTAVQVEHEDREDTVTDWWFDAAGKLLTVCVCD